MCVAAPQKLYMGTRKTPGRCRGPGSGGLGWEGRPTTGTGGGVGGVGGWEGVGVGRRAGCEEVGVVRKSGL